MRSRTLGATRLEELRLHRPQPILRGRKLRVAHFRGIFSRWEKTEAWKRDLRVELKGDCRFREGRGVWLEGTPALVRISFLGANSRYEWEKREA